MVHFYLSTDLEYGISEVGVFRCFGSFFSKVEVKDGCSLAL